MGCEDVRDALLEGRLEDRSHLDECASCQRLDRRIREEEAAFHTVIGAWVEQPPQERRSWNPYLTRALVVLAIAATLGLVFYSLRTSPPDRPERPATRPVPELDQSEVDRPGRTEEEPVPLDLNTRIPIRRSGPRPSPRPAPAPLPRTTPRPRPR